METISNHYKEPGHTYVYEEDITNMQGPDLNQRQVARILRIDQGSKEVESESGGSRPPLTKLSRNSAKPVDKPTASSSQKPMQGQSSQSGRVSTTKGTAAARHRAGEHNNEDDEDDEEVAPET